MASNVVGVLVDMSVRGRDAVRGASDDLSRVDGASTRARGGLVGLGSTLVATSAAFGAAAFAVKKLYDGLRAGAVLSTTQERFDKLSDSIGTTADTMLGKLRTATQGMISDMDLMSSASQIMSLKLADNEDQVVRLATVAGTLGWDMQQVILTFANMSTMRLDALGLSVEEVKNKAAELEKAGMSAQEAFKEAVILAGEARLDVGGVSDTEQAFKQLEASIANVRNELSLAAVELAKSLGLIDAMSASAEKMGVAREYRDMIQAAKEAGTINPFEAAMRVAAIAEQDVDEVRQSMQLLNTEMGNGDYAANQWASGVMGAMSAAQAAIMATRGAAALLNAEFRAAVMPGGLDWMGGTAARTPMMLADPARDNRLKWWALREQARARGADAQGPFANLEEQTASLGGYSGAVNAAASAEQALAAAHSQLAQAFLSEVGMKPEEGLIDDAGLVNVKAMNEALLSQGRAAGMTAGQMAMLGVATGQYTQEQAQAALKAAILSEKIRQVAVAVASGEMDLGGAMGGLDAFRQQLDAGQIDVAASSIEGLAGAADSFAGDYAAQLTVEDRAARAAIDEAITALGGFTGTHTAQLVVTTQGATPGSGGVDGGRASGGPVRRDRPYFVGEAGPELFVPGMAGQVVPNNQLRDLLGGVSGGSSYNVNVTNYVDGKRVSRTHLDDITSDSMMAALKSLGVR